MPDLPEIPPDADPPSGAAAGLRPQDHAYARLRHAIMVGAIGPETTLTIRGLAAALGFSPTPIREAIRRLVSEQAIDLKDNRRLAIPPMTRARFDALVSLRIAVETHAAAQALPHVSDALVARLRAMDDAMDAMVAGVDLDALTIANHDFHRTLYRAAPEPVALPLAESLWLQLGPFQRRVLGQSGEFRLVDRHKDLLAALDRRDGAALAAAIRADIDDGIGQAGRLALGG